MLYLFTAGFPFKGEPFLENEVDFMPEDTKIFAFNAKVDYETTKINRNVYKVFSTKHKTLAILYVILGFLDKVFLEEIFLMIKNKKFSINNIKLFIKFYGTSMVLYRQILSHVKKDGIPKSIYSYWMMNQAFVAVKLKKKYPNIFTVSRCHGYDLYEYRYKGEYIPFRNFLYNNLDYILPISLDGKYYIENLGYRNNIKVSRLGTRDCGINPCKNDNTITIASCSSLIPLKRVDKILDVVNELGALGYKVHWIHFGDGVLRSELETKVLNLNKVNIKVDFRGNVDNEIILDFYKKNHIDVFINSSLYEGIPVSIMEATSFGIPVIATDVGGVKEIIENKKNGYLVSVDCPISDIIECIKELKYGKKNLWFRENCRDLWKVNYDGKVNYQEFYNLLRNRD